jgi:hypothetical protein
MLCGGYEEFMVYVMTTQHIMNVMWGLYAYVMMTPWVKVFRIFWVLSGHFRDSPKSVQKIFSGGEVWKLALGSKKKDRINFNGWLYRGLIFLKRRVKIAIVDCSYVKFTTV